MAMRMAGFFWRMPRLHPTASTVITGILGLVLFIEGIGLSVTTTSTGQSNVAGGVIVCILGLVAAGWAGYAAYETQYFKNWARADGSYKHPLVRWAGPIFLIVALIEFVVALWIIARVLEGMSRS